MGQMGDPLRLYPAVKVAILFSVIILLIRVTGLSAYFPPNHALVFSLAAFIFLVAAALFCKGWKIMPFTAFITGIIFLVSARYPSDNFEPSHISRFTHLGRPVAVKGIVSRDPQVIKDKTRLILNVRSIQLTQHIELFTQGKLMVSLRDEARVPVSYGDELILYGQIYAPRNERNPGEFDFAKYLAIQDIFGQMYVREAHQVEATGRSEANPILKDFIHPIKHYVLALDRSTLSPLSASILTGLLVGERGDIPSEVLDYFSTSGTIHILSISGLHIVFITALLFGVFSFLRLRYAWRVYMTLVCLLIYMGVADFIPSVVRAGIMTGMVLIGTLSQRRGNIINSLFVSLIIILFMQPLALFDIGLQLSFTAVLSIVLVYPRLEELCKRIGFFTSGEMNITEKIIALLLVSVAAQIGTIPFTAFYFHKIPLIALAANVLVVPLSSFVMGIGFVSAIVGTFSMTAAQWFANVNEWSILLMVKIAEWSSKIPLAYIEFYRMDLWSMFFFYLILAYFLMWKNMKVRKYGLIAALLFTVAMAWKPVLFPDKGLQLIFLDVGQGDAAVIRTPQNKTILIDGGDCGGNMDQGEKVVAPFLRKIGVGRIDYLIMTHPHDDHIGGIEYVLRHFDIGAVIDPGQFYRSDVYFSILSRIHESNIARHIVRSGDFLAIDNEVELYFMHPQKPCVSGSSQAPFNTNNASVVFQLRYRGVRALFMGDAEQSSLKELESYGELLQSDVLKVSHHGSWNGTSKAFISKVQPRFSVISCGEFNKFNHPSPAVVRDLALSGSRIYRTDEEGAVIFKTDENGVYRRR